MANQQQTVLKVQTRQINYTTPSGYLSVNTGTTMTISGSGTTLNPYSGTTSTSNSYAIFDVNINGGTLYYGILGQTFIPPQTGFTVCTISLTRNGQTYLIKETTKTTPFILDDIIVNAGDQITVSFPTSPLQLLYLYFVENTGSTLAFENEILDTYTDIPIKINKSFAELQDISKRNSDYSIGLSLPGSKTNNAFFEDFFNVDVKFLYFNPTKRVPAQVLINDELYFEGYMKLNKVNVLNSKVEYDVTLYSNIGDLFGKIGNNLLKDLNFTNPTNLFNHTFNTSAIVDSWDEKGFLNNEPNPYLYPIVHNGYEYDGDTVRLSGITEAQNEVVTRLYTTSAPINSYSGETAMLAAGVKPYRINTKGTGILDNQLKPAMNVYRLMQLIFETYGYKIKSNFFNTPWMKGLYMYGYYNNDTTKLSYRTTPPIIPPVQSVEVNLFSRPGRTFDPCPVVLISTIEFRVVNTQTGAPEPATQIYGLSLDFTLFEPLGQNTDYNVGLIIPQGSTGTTYTWLQEQDFLYGPSCFTQFRLYEGINLNNSTIYDREQKTVPQNVILKDGDYIDFSRLIDINLKQIDIISSIAKKFNLVFVPNPNNPLEIIIEPYQYYIGTGRILDWTNKLSFDKGFSVEPALNYIESELIFTDLEDGDDGNKQFKDKNNRIYGQNYVFNKTDFKSTQKKIETIFSPEITRKWDDNVIIPLGINYSASSSSEGSGGSEKVKWSYKGVKTKPKLFYYLGNFSPFFNVVDGIPTAYPVSNVWNTYQFYIQSSDAKDTTLVENVPIISNTMPLGNPDYNKINNDSICILFNSEQPADVGVETFNGINAYTDQDMYNLFYQNRINNLYNENTRFLSGYMDLKISDIKNLSPTDLIKINEKYFTWNKIEGYNLTNPELTKVELIQIDNNPSQYPIRYFQYYYCANSSIKYNIRTDFTNPEMIKTHFYLSNFYDFNVGLLGGNVTGFTSSFEKAPSTYLPFTIYEITQDTYNTTGFTYASDPNFDWDDKTQVIDELPNNYWFTSGWTGLNLWENCSGFTQTATTRGMIVATPISGTPITVYTTGITINVTDTGWIKYNTPTGQVYQFVENLGTYIISECADCTSILPGFPNADLASWVLISCGNTC